MKSRWEFVEIKIKTHPGVSAVPPSKSQVRQAEHEHVSKVTTGGYQGFGRRVNVSWLAERRIKDGEGEE